MATELKAGQLELLEEIKTHFPIDFFTAAQIKEATGRGRAPTQSLNALVNKGILETKNGAYRLVPEGADTSIATFAVEDKKVTTDAVSALFGVRNIIDATYRNIENWMNTATYATEPESQRGIYKIVDARNDRILYIGKTERPFETRWADHRAGLISKSHHCKRLNEYFDQELNCNIELIKFDIVEELPLDSTIIDIRERYWIDHYKDTVLNTNHPSLVNFTDALPKMDLDSKAKVVRGLREIAVKTAARIHDYLYASVKLSDQNKATLIAGIVIALNRASFANTYKSIVDEDEFIDSFVNAIKWSIQKYTGLKSGHDAVIASFDFIKHNSNFKKTLEDNGKTYIALQLLTEIIENSICRIAKDYPEYDVMGDFYNEFAKYSGADQQALGIVLTPHHVADFMSDLLEINENDTILDICCGTGALPIAAHHYPTNKIVGVEYQERMMALCLANMIMRNYQSTLYLGDSFGEEMLKAVKEQKPTKMIINPPYAQDGYPEMGFVRRGLDQLVEGGLGVAIVPMSCAIKSDKTLKALKEEILSKHQLLATFSMPDQLFYPVGVVTIVMLFRAHVPHEGSSFFGYLKDDGFEITRTSGRQDQGRWSKIKDEMLTLYRNYEEKAGISALAEVWEGDEWCCEAYMKTDYSGITPEMFKKEMINYVLFNLNKGE
jgi:type I restriction-modification system DNA methylase subunit